MSHFSSPVIFPSPQFAGCDGSPMLIPGSPPLAPPEPLLPFDDPFVIPGPEVIPFVPEPPFGSLDVPDPLEPPEPAFVFGFVVEPVAPAVPESGNLTSGV